MAEVANELRRNATGLVDGPLTWRPSGATLEMPFTPPPDTSSERRQSRRWLLVSVGGVALLMLTAVGGWRLYWKPRHVPPPVQAQESPVEDNAYALYQRARDDLDHFDREGNTDKAIKLLERAVQLNPQSAASYAALAEAYYMKNRSNPDPQWMKLTSEYASKAVALDNYLAAAHVSLGLVAIDSGDSAGAEKEFRTASDLDPKSSVPHRRLGELYTKTGRADQSAQELDRALQLDPSDWKVNVARGVNHYQAGQYKEAGSAFEQALKLEPDSVPILQNLGGVYHMLGRDDDAAAALQRALEIKPEADTYNNLGTIRFFQGHYQDSVPAFEKTVALGANNFDNWGNLADAYRWTPGNADKARKAYQTAVQLVREEIAKHPQQMDLRADLAMYLAKSGGKDDALRELARVEAAHPKDPQVLYSVAVVYELCGNRDKALDSLQAAVQAGQGLSDIKNEPEFVSLRSDPRYHLNILTAAEQKSSR
jgi:serine/threonine-protein kinase